MSARLYAMGAQVPSQRRGHASVDTWPELATTAVGEVFGWASTPGVAHTAAMVGHRDARTKSVGKVWVDLEPASPLGL